MAHTASPPADSGLALIPKLGVVGLLGVVVGSFIFFVIDDDDTEQAPSPGASPGSTALQPSTPSTPSTTSTLAEPTRDLGEVDSFLAEAIDLIDAIYGEINDANTDWERRRSPFAATRERLLDAAAEIEGFTASRADL